VGGSAGGSANVEDGAAMRKSVTISEFYRTWGKGQIGTDERLREEQSSIDERLREEQRDTA
jgi:hypothetical protein